jgi:spoIIIJ-associated protein
MGKTYVFEGKTTTEAIEKGLNELKVSKNKVDIKVLESEEKRSFFSILTPRVVKVEITLKDEKEVVQKEVKEQHESKKKEVSEEGKEKAISDLNNFLNSFISTLGEENIKYSVEYKDGNVEVDINGENVGYLIGYRGETLNSLQVILNNIASKNVDEKVKVLLNINGYREKREKDLEILASKIAGTVIKTKKSITLEPMSAYERKIIHTKLQQNDKVKTYSIGEEPHRKVVVALK